jgi:hypothetical protein
MLLSEMVRQLTNEQQLINDATSYNTSSKTWATLKDYGNITLSQDTMVIFSFTYTRTKSGGGVACNLRLKIGSVYATGYPGGVGTDTVTGMIWLAAGTYDVLAEGVADYYDGNNYVKPAISNMKLGRAKLADTARNGLAVYSSQLNFTLNSRVACLGATTQAVLFVQVFARTSGAATNFENVGDNLTNGVSISADAAQKNYTTRQQDNQTGQSNSVFGAATATLCLTLAIGTHTLSFSKRNANTEVSVSILFSPWILNSVDTQFVTLNFPRGSTIYLTLEPLVSDPSKTVKIGSKRAVSFGDTTDYYHTASGTGILNDSYTFETVDTTNCIVVSSGLGGCISIIGVDIR